MTGLLIQEGKKLALDGRRQAKSDLICRWQTKTDHEDVTVLRCYSVSHEPTEAFLYSSPGGLIASGKGLGPSPSGSTNFTATMADGSVRLAGPDVSFIPDDEGPLEGLFIEV
jgi:hypothetical protein